MCFVLSLSLFFFLLFVLVFLLLKTNIVQTIWNNININRISHTHTHSHIHNLIINSNSNINNINRTTEQLALHQTLRESSRMQLHIYQSYNIARERIFYFLFCILFSHIISSIYNLYKYLFDIYYTHFIVIIILIQVIYVLACVSSWLNSNFQHDLVDHRIRHRPTDRQVKSVSVVLFVTLENMLFFVLFKTIERSPMIKKKHQQQQGPQSSAASKQAADLSSEVETDTIRKLNVM